MQPSEIQSRQPPLKWSHAVGSGFFSLCLYLSGFFVWLTPLPIFYAFRFKQRFRALLALIFPLAALWFCYQILFPYALQRLGAERAMQYFFWLPGLQLVSEPLLSSPALFGILYYALLALMGCLLGEFGGRKISLTRLIGQIALIVLAAMAIGSVLFSKKMLVSLQGLEDSVVRMFDELSRLTTVHQDLDRDLVIVKDHAREIAYYVVRLLPAAIINTVIFVLWFNLWVAKRVLAGTGAFQHLGEFRYWRFPFAGVWGAIAAGAVLLLEGYLIQTQVLRLVALNVVLVLAWVYFFQGLAIAAFALIERWALPMGVRLAVYLAFILFFQPLFFVLVALGFFDSWFDLRKLGRKAA